MKNLPAKYIYSVCTLDSILVFEIMAVKQLRYLMEVHGYVLWKNIVEIADHLIWLL